MLIHKTSLWKVILIAGLVAGTLDITAACVQAYLVNNTTPETILRYIASAVLGKDAFKGGMGVAALGLLFHYMIATALAAFFVMLYLNIRWIRKHVVLSGLLYGILAWVLTARLLVPLTRIHVGPIVWEKAIIAILILMFMIGLPIALITRKYLSRR
jgi:hypothetical protein